MSYADSKQALYCLSADVPRDEWFRVAAAFKAAGGEFEVFDQWSQQAPERYDAPNCRATWDSISPDKGISENTLYYLAREAGYNPASLPSAPPPAPPDPARKVAAIYEYRDRCGRVQALNIRYEPKDFRPRYAIVLNADPVQYDDVKQWAKTKPQDFTMPLFNEDKIASRPCETLYMVEGEKDAIALEKLGYLVSCHKAGGAVVRTGGGLLEGRQVIIIADNDPSGTKYAEAARANLAKEALRVSVVYPPQGKDFFDWLELQDSAATVEEVNARFEEWAMPPGDKEEQIATLAFLLERIHKEGSADPNELIKNRFLCKGGAGILAAETGCGKSSFVMQAALGWAIGRQEFGLEPARPLKILIIQAENDPRDIAEEVTGITQGMTARKLLSAPQIRTAMDGVKIISNSSSCGDGFIELLANTLAREKDIDLVIVDPLFAYCGCDISNQADMSRFLRNGITPIIQRAGVGLIFVHHMAKPAKAADINQNYNQSYNYHGSGEVVNWARFSLVLERFKGETEGFFFRLIAPKRGRRLQWEKKYLKWADDAIYWEELEYVPAITAAPAKFTSEERAEQREEEKRQRLQEDAERAADILKPGETIGKTDFRRRIMGDGIATNNNRACLIMDMCIAQGLVIERQPKEGEGGKGVTKVIEKPLPSPAPKEQAELL